ncbi:hypothetical protein [Spiroplasma cantharicola]|uniref:PD-(D/E)XK motif protein n=1 Tax=Spiroplasma cantharicola TaxID=362837 RepID=A0A0M3SJE1_9MOLU|nr:hypothetical protein [Spiroplasma cantharicola]ALD66574.1 hypothetical protein SCANT_v1c06680 [Spiroplasma cantharicola]
MKKFINKNDNNNLYLVEEIQEFTKEKRWFILKKESNSNESFRYLNFNYIGQAVGKIEGIQFEGEVLAFNNNIELSIIQESFKLITKLINNYKSIYNLLEFIENFIQKVLAPDFLELQGIYAELAVIWKWKFLGKNYRSYNYSKKDFYIKEKDYYIEVKSTTKKNDNVYKIGKDQIDNKNTLFITTRLNREGILTNILDLYKNVSEYINEDSFIHIFFQNKANWDFYNNIKFNLSNIKYKVYNLEKFNNSIIIKNDRVINYTIDFDFSGLKDIKLFNNLEEEFNEIFRK